MGVMKKHELYHQMRSERIKQHRMEKMKYVRILARADREPHISKPGNVIIFTHMNLMKRF